MPISTSFGVIASYGALAMAHNKGKLTPEVRSTVVLHCGALEAWKLVVRSVVYVSQGIDDRAYRIEHNVGQMTVDKYSLIGGLIGAADGAILGKFGLRSVAASSLTGVAAGVAVYGVKTMLLPKLLEGKSDKA